MASIIVQLDEHTIYVQLHKWISTYIHAHTQVCVEESEDESMVEMFVF